MTDPALEGTLWLYRVVRDSDPSDPWRLDVWSDQAWDGTGYGPGWSFGGRWNRRVHAEQKMLRGAQVTVHLWRASLARVFHGDYELEAVEVYTDCTVLVERVRRYFWHTEPVFDGYAAA